MLTDKFRLCRRLCEKCSIAIETRRLLGIFGHRLLLHPFRVLDKLLFHIECVCLPNRIWMVCLLIRMNGNNNRVAKACPTICNKTCNTCHRTVCQMHRQICRHRRQLAAICNSNRPYRRNRIQWCRPTGWNRPKGANIWTRKDFLRMLSPSDRNIRDKNIVAGRLGDHRLGFATMLEIQSIFLKFERKSISVVLLLLLLLPSLYTFVIAAYILTTSPLK